MLSENYSHTSSTIQGSHEPLASGHLSALAAETQLRRFVHSADPWLAIVVVGLSAWASWGAINWLLQSWQLY